MNSAAGNLIELLGRPCAWWLGLYARGPRHASLPIRRRRCQLLVMSSGQERDRTTHEDAAVVAAVLQGDDEAFSSLVEKHQATIAQQMQRFSRDATVVEELVHDVFVEAYVSLKSYHSKAPLIHWLRKIAVRVGYRYWKRRVREREAAVPLSVVGERLHNFEAGAARPSAAADILHGLLERLSPRDRLVLTLLYWDGLSISEAADLTGWSQAMVKVQAHRARKRLKALIEEADRE